MGPGPGGGAAPLDVVFLPVPADPGSTRRGGRRPYDDPSGARPAPGVAGRRAGAGSPARRRHPDRGPGPPGRAGRAGPGRRVGPGPGRAGRAPGPVPADRHRRHRHRHRDRRRRGGGGSFDEALATAGSPARPRARSSSRYGTVPSYVPRLVRTAAAGKGELALPPGGADWRLDVTEPGTPRRPRARPAPSRRRGRSPRARCGSRCARPASTSATC